MKNPILLGAVAAIAWLAYFWILLLFTQWLALKKHSGGLLLDLGQPGYGPKGTRLLRFAGVILGLWSFMTLADSLLSYHAGTVTVRDLIEPVACLAASVFFTYKARGLSLREEGILAPECLICWLEIVSYACEEGSGTLSVRMRGAGTLRALVGVKPARDKGFTWPIPVAQQAAVRQILAQRVQVQATAG